MAFGLGFNKQKLLSSAEKFVQQGKLQNAITEYEKIRKHDTKDLTVANTIGDLYSRLGQIPKAIECFKAVGDAYAAQGFTVKGIAMYKKITKLEPSVDGSLKLAELYTQQGLFNDARSQYLQVAEDFVKAGHLDHAVRLFQKVLEMDPENVPMRVKLADAYIRLGKTTEAFEIFSAAAESLRSRGSLAAAEDILQRMLTLDPGNSYVLLMRGRAALDNGNPKAAIQYLEKASDIDSHPDGLHDLLKAYVEVGNLSQCATVAEKLLRVHNDPDGLFLVAAGATQLGQHSKALEIYTSHADRLLAADSDKLLGNLHALITHVQGDAGALEKLLALLEKSGESTHVNEVVELLAHACVKKGSVKRAHDLYKMLAASEPQNPMHAQNCREMATRLDELGKNAASNITADEGLLILEELEATAPAIDAPDAEGMGASVRAALTDAELFLSYNLPEKALPPLIGALAQAPEDVRLNQRMAMLHTRLQEFAKAAVCCRTLENRFEEAGHSEEAASYGQLAGRYEHTAGFAATPAHALPKNAPVADDAAQTKVATPEDAAAAADLKSSAAGALDALSDSHVPVEASLSTKTTSAEPEASDAEIEETAEEIRFYLEHFMAEQARSAYEKLKTLTHDATLLASLKAAIESAPKSPEEPEAEISEISEIEPVALDDPATFEIKLETPDAAKTADFSVLASPEVAHHENVAGDLSAESHRSASKNKNHADDEHGDTNELSSLVANLENSLGNSFLGSPSGESTTHNPDAAVVAKAAAIPAVPKPEPMAAAGQTKAAAAAAAGAGAGAASGMMTFSPMLRPLGSDGQDAPRRGIDLSEIFGGLKNELEEGAPPSDEDPETHYNLGVAFREMGLLDEAIAELQKVCTAIDRGHSFAAIVQTYTWLAQCFLDKGMPQAAIPWYEKALALPGLDGETLVAINYELGTACESAHDKTGALRHFMHVYGANIDYRDVAERIQALKS